MTRAGRARIRPLDVTYRINVFPDGVVVGGQVGHRNIQKENFSPRGARACWTNSLIHQMLANARLVIFADHQRKVTAARGVTAGRPPRRAFTLRSWPSRTARKRIPLAPPSIDQLVENDSAYKYYRGPQTRWLANEAQAVRASQSILAPTLSDPNFLVNRVRTQIFSRWAEDLPRAGLCVLDVGGRLQPYRPIIQDKLHFYVAIDPTPEGLLNVVAVERACHFARIASIWRSAHKS